MSLVYCILQRGASSVRDLDRAFVEGEERTRRPLLAEACGYAAAAEMIQPLGAEQGWGTGSGGRSLGPSPRRQRRCRSR